MRFYKLNSVPEIRFAHEYSADSYNNSLPASVGAYELGYIVEGELEIEQNGVTVTAKKGDVMFSDRSEAITVRCDGKHSHATVCFKADMTEAEDGLCLPWTFTPSGHRADAVMDIIKKIIRTKTMYGDSAEGRAQCSAEIIRLLAEYSSAVRETTDDKSNAYVRAAMDYVYHNIEKPIKERDVAAHLGITPEYLCSIFKNNTDTTFIKAVNRMKLERIRSVMEREGATLAVASSAYGYDDANYVSRLYKQMYGESITKAVRK